MENATVRRAGRTWRIGGNDFVGGSEQIEKRAEEVRRSDTTRRDVEFEGRAWRTPGVQIVARSAKIWQTRASGKSHRSVTEEQEKEKLTDSGLPSRTPLRCRFCDFVFFRVLFSLAETNRIDSVPDSWFIMRSFQSKLRPIADNFGY